MGCESRRSGLSEVLVGFSHLYAEAAADRIRVSNAYAISDVITASYFYPLSECEPTLDSSTEHI